MQFPSAAAVMLVFALGIPGREAQAQTNAWSATDAIVRAVRHATGANVFNIYSRDGTGRADDHFRLVQISARRDTAGACRVLFEPTGNGVATNAVLEVILSSTNILARKLTQREFGVSRADDGRFCNAVEAALKHHWRGLRYPASEAQIAVSIMKMPGDEFMVMVQEIPAFPGGHTAYVFSSSNQLRAVIPGE